MPDAGGEAFGVEVVAREHGEPARHLPADGGCGLLDLVGRGTVDEQADQVLAATLALAGTPACSLA